MSLIKFGLGPTSYNYYVLRGLFDQKVIEEARAVAAALPAQEGVYSRTGANKMYAYLDQIPTLVQTLAQLTDELHIIGSNYFCSEPTPKGKAAHGEWHSGHSLYFAVKGYAMTLWIPLQDLDATTGGRLKLYNGKYISQMDDLLNVQVRGMGNSISNEHSILRYLNHELEEGHVVEDMAMGDALLFDEMLPHQAERCNIHREVLAVRLVIGPYELDKPLIERVLERYKSSPGEIGYAAEYLENLLKYEEYRFDRETGRPLDQRVHEDMPVAGPSTRRNIWQRAAQKLKG